MSIHLEYIDQMLSGRKRYELRRVRSSFGPGTRLWMCATSPTTAVIGWLRMGSGHVVALDSPVNGISDLWHDTGDCNIFVPFSVVTSKPTCNYLGQIWGNSRNSLAHYNAFTRALRRNGPNVTTIATAGDGVYMLPTSHDGLPDIAWNRSCAGCDVNGAFLPIGAPITRTTDEPNPYIWQLRFFSSHKWVLQAPSVVQYVASLATQ